MLGSCFRYVLFDLLRFPWGHACSWICSVACSRRAPFRAKGSTGVDGQRFTVITIVAISSIVFISVTIRTVAFVFTLPQSEITCQNEILNPEGAVSNQYQNNIVLVGQGRASRASINTVFKQYPCRPRSGDSRASIKTISKPNVASNACSAQSRVEYSCGAFRSVEYLS